MSFKKIQGQPHALDTLRGFIKSARIPRAMIFAGPSGVGKATAALEFAKTLNCLNGGEDNCGVCQNCTHIDAKTHPDIIFADFACQAALRGEELEKQQTIRVDTIRALTAASQQRPAMAKWKVYIIDSAEKLLEEGANALLKFIEEPPQNTVWILVSSKREAMLPTIKSRCQTINFMPLADDIIIKILTDNYIEPSLAAASASYAGGSTAKAALAAEVLGDFAALPTGAAFAPAAAMNLSKTLAQARVQAGCILDMLAVAAHKKWAAAPESKQPDLKELLSKIVFYKKALGRNTAPPMVLEAALMAAADCGISIS